jgi:chorismate-pyruvate lyase
LEYVYEGATSLCFYVCKVVQFAPQNNRKNSLVGHEINTMLDNHLALLERLSLSPAHTPASLLAPFTGLPPFLRALLVADGTVTLLLSAYFSEDIGIKTHNQMSLIMPSPLPQLGLQTGSEVFYREVELYGLDSHRSYATAVSLINPKALNPALFEELIGEHVGMGEVLRNSARGSYRELLDVQQKGDDEASRTYTVFLEGHPAILITERFNTRCF